MIFVKRNMVERTNKAEIRPEEQSQKMELVSCCFKPSQPLWITSGLKETFMKKDIAERTNEAEIGPEEQSWTAESCRENIWNEIQLKGP